MAEQFTDERREQMMNALDKGNFREADRLSKNGQNQTWMASDTVLRAENAHRYPLLHASQEKRYEVIQKGRDEVTAQFDKNRTMERSEAERVKDLARDSQRVFGDRG